MAQLWSFRVIKRRTNQHPLQKNSMAAIPKSKKGQRDSAAKDAKRGIVKIKKIKLQFKFNDKKCIKQKLRQNSNTADLNNMLREKGKQDRYGPVSKLL